MSDYKKVASGLLVSLLGLSLMAQVQAAGKKGRTPRVAAPAIYVALSNAWTICINWALMPSG